MKTAETKVLAPSVKKMTTKTKPETIKSMFGEIAPKYDAANAILSFGLHKFWNRRLAKSADKNNPEILLDLCAGTGEIAYLWLKRQKTLKTAILLDFCPEMLDIAATRAPKNHELSFIEGDAQNLPIPDNSVDAITIAYGIRNVSEPKLCFQEVFRTLKPNGSFSILELTEPNHSWLRWGHTIYLNKLLPFLGGIITRKPQAYRYLSSSIQAFVRPEVLTEHLNQIGFKNIKAEPLSGGIAHLITCNK